MFQLSFTSHWLENQNVCYNCAILLAVNLDHKTALIGSHDLHLHRTCYKLDILERYLQYCILISFNVSASQFSLLRWEQYLLIQTLK